MNIRQLAKLPAPVLVLLARVPTLAQDAADEAEEGTETVVTGTSIRAADAAAAPRFGPEFEPVGQFVAEAGDEIEPFVIQGDGGEDE